MSAETVLPPLPGAPGGPHLPSPEELLEHAVAVSLPMTVRFRGTTRREALLLRGPFGWAEFSPFPEYGDQESSRWLAAAIEAGWLIAEYGRQPWIIDGVLPTFLAASGLKLHQIMITLSGFVLMQKSPSCGLHRVKLYRDNGHLAEKGSRGIFAAALHARYPELPLEEEGRLHDPVLRENFITRVYAHAEWQRLLQQGLTRRALIAYHSRYKYLLMATDPLRYKSLGRMLGNIAQHDLGELAPRYFSELMSALKKCATRRTHSNVLQHLSGYLKRALSADEKQEMQQLISQYRDGIVPLVVPMTLLKHHFRRHPDRYIAEQAYMQPHPEPLALRNAL